MHLAHLALSTLGLAALAVAQSNVSLDWIPFNRTQFDGHAALDTDGHVQLFWRIGEEYSTFGIASQSSGYLALGFSETGAMTGADMAVGYRGDNGSFVFENRHATGFVTPQVSLDQTINMRLQEGEQDNGVTSFIFEKKNQADCYGRQNSINSDAWQWFIYAHSDQNTFAQHGPGNMGKEYVKLGTGKTVSVLDARPVNNTQEFIVLQPEVTIPPVETTYCYSMHKMPAGEKNFLVGERPVASSPLLHHLVLYACYGASATFADMLDKEPNCDWETFSNPCIGFVTEWAPGMSARTFEDGYGKPFGADYYEYAMLETHYNNPEQLVGEKDAASYTFIYTDQQVDTEIGTLTLGDLQVNGWFMDPGKELVAKTTICTPECTGKWPAEGITAVSVFHHMHFRGRNARVQIIRNGTEIAPLSSLRDFDYGYQFSKALDNIQLLPGDQLITTCEYNTMNDTMPVPGGQPSSSEMCFAWVDYYPLNSVLACTQIDPALSDPSQPHGAAGMCLVSTSPEPDVYASTAFTTPFQQLPVLGDNCTSDALSVPGASGAAILNTCPETDVCFSLNVPEQSQSSGSGDIYFQLSAPTTYAWVALAQGTMMSNANIFLMHSSADGSNVTLSPRSTTGHVMPTHNDAADITLLEGSGISNGRMTANDTSSDWVYAHQRGPAINSDDMNVAITQHDTEGGFQWDLSRATGGPDANPFLATGANTTTSSSSAGGAHSQTGMAQAHGAMASIAFVAIFPSGAILVRLASLPGLAWIHGGLQVFGYVVFVAAAGLGIFMASRDDYLQEPHAIIGILLLAVFFFMPIIGTIHHKMFKRVQKRTVWTYGHIFTGRIGIVLGMVNGGLGLQLANAESAYIIAYGVFAGLMGAGYISTIVFAEIKRSKTAAGPSLGSDEGKRLDRQGSGSGSDQ
ncbi:hypothetical protein LTR56_019128 [Elasticomyces elasticus]|nr:hypothetical protein LTR56_019128 [Elasticomyces elasticus]KAK4911501.1 hypothetical protein LTR49_019912 [Elasticomyces elasticus]KAK5751076.1 hypothetical protein LTS12_018886 [Elasticomyces elasticus]